MHIVVFVRAYYDINNQSDVLLLSILRHNYGHVDTTNLVERHWQFLKYIALRGRINRSNTDLVHVLIGNCGGMVHANCKDERSRLKEAERILERYVTDRCDRGLTEPG